ncbi:hypothetical protein M9H77_26639 [Catharanthus roseus]|uniref:Uncharacterized protein n=1 Tax=Catharanthus roseus TaxID=4058 RepID=A0ACC0AB76_CATRO|nr:hypothetical protein M9H77_26639 [Catharanthus roseus]
MDPIDVETVLLLMRNLSINLTSPDFEDHYGITDNGDITELHVILCGTPQTNCYSLFCISSPWKGERIGFGLLVNPFYIWHLTFYKILFQRRLLSSYEIELGKEDGNDPTNIIHDQRVDVSHFVT